MALNGNHGTNQLANVLVGRIQKENGYSLLLDFGDIGADGSLTTKTFPVPTLKGAYSVLRQLSLGLPGQGQKKDKGEEDNAKMD